MRAQQPGALRGLHRRRAQPRRRRGRHRAGQHRRAVVRLRARCGLPGAMFTASHNPGQLQRDQVLPPGAQPIEPAQLVAIADRAIGGRRRARRRGPRHARPSRTCSPRTRTTCTRWSTCPGIRRLKVVADAGNGMAGHTLPAVLGRSEPRADRALHRPGRHLPQPRAQPAGAGEPGRRPGGGASSTAPTWPWSSTATPTAASSSTSGARWSARRRSPA